MTRQRLGQHFLVDPEWREQIARAIRVSRQSLAPPGDGRGQEYCWIEIGAGRGEMTEHLAASGAPVLAIELDHLLIGRLRKLAKQFSNLTIVAADVLETDIAGLAGAGQRVRIYGNLPYYITSPILQHLFESAAAIDEIHIVIQTEVARRLAAEPGSRDYGYLTVLTRMYSRPEFVFEIPKGAFEPPPEVTSALVTLRLPGQRAGLGLQDEAGFLEFVKLCFSQKRKTLVNNLRSMAGAEVTRAALAELGLRVDARGEQLSVKEFAGLYGRLGDVEGVDERFGERKR